MKAHCFAATNTTIDKSAVANSRYGSEQGGLSGPPVRDPSTAVVRMLHRNLQGEIPIIGIGGIHNVETAIEKIDAGASLIQIYTSLIYHGPKLVGQLAKALAQPDS